MLLASSASTAGDNNFLIPNGTFIVELVMFVVVLGVVAKFILPPLQKVMSDRDATVRGSLLAGDEGRTEADRLARERRETIEHAHAEARAILEVATREAERLREEARAEAQAVFERDLSAAQAVIEVERRQLRSDTLARLDTIVVEAAERVIGVGVDVDRHREAIAAAVASAGAVGETSSDGGTA
jgi:F-type H+-transporting ATPase subunit b